MQVSQIAYVQSDEATAVGVLLEQVAGLLRRVCTALGSESCGWLTDLYVGDDPIIDPRCGLTVTRIAPDKILLTLNAASTQVCMTKDEMAAVAAYQRAAWTPSLQMWPLTAWSKKSAGHAPETTVCIPLHGPNGTTSIVFVPIGANAPRWYETALMFVGPLLEAERELRAAFMQQPMECARLTPQEVESLKWASKGKTAWESGTIQGIPERTVVQRLKRAREKLGAGSTALAIGIAAKQGLFHTP
jgi:DNA-binding CsgD family transcriptional regulator